MSPQFLVYLLIVVMALAVIIWVVFSSRGRAVQAKAQADVDELHTKVDSIHTRISNLVAEVRGLKITTAQSSVPQSSGGPTSPPQP